MNRKYDITATAATREKENYLQGLASSYETHLSYKTKLTNVVNEKNDYVDFSF